jgi:hypothetical protein
VTTDTHHVPRNRRADAKVGTTSSTAGHTRDESDSCYPRSYSPWRWIGSSLHSCKREPPSRTSRRLRVKMPLTDRQGYDAMFLFLFEFWERGNRSSQDIAQLLGWLQHGVAWADDTSSDPAMDEDWASCVRRVRRGTLGFIKDLLFVSEPALLACPPLPPAH